MNDAIEHLLSLSPYTTPDEQKKPALLAAVAQALRHHASSCPLYARFLERHSFDVGAELKDFAAIPPLPGPIFKKMRLVSGDEREIVRTIASSGTSSQIPSRIALDNITRARQMRVLASQLGEIIGPKRRPFLVIDVDPKQPVAGDADLSARIAGMRGYLMAASETTYMLESHDEVPAVLLRRLRMAIDHLSAARILFCIIGYTYMLHQQLIAPLIRQSESLRLPPDALVLHFGGWKKLADRAISRSTFSNEAAAAFGLPPERVIDIYGFTEQLGVIYPDDEFGVKRCPVYSEVLIRDPITLKIVPNGESGFMEFITPLPGSYPGVAILLDDMGRIVARESGRYQGTAFEVLGRAANAEVRGCGDTLPDQVYEIAR